MSYVKQVVYAMDNMNLPEIDPVSVLAVAELCNATDAANCTQLNAMFACLAIPTDWKFHNDRVYMPYAWADESIVGTSDDADSIKEIYGIQDLGNKVSFWCYVVSGLLAMLIMGMFFGRRYLEQEIVERESMAERKSEHSIMGSDEVNSTRSDSFAGGLN